MVLIQPTNGHAHAMQNQNQNNHTTHNPKKNMCIHHVLKYPLPSLCYQTHNNNKTIHNQYDAAGQNQNITSHYASHSNTYAIHTYISQACNAITIKKIKPKAMPCPHDSNAYTLHTHIVNQHTPSYNHAQSQCTNTQSFSH